MNGIQLRRMSLELHLCCSLLNHVRFHLKINDYENSWTLSQFYSLVPQEYNTLELNININVIHKTLAHNNSNPCLSRDISSEGGKL